MKTGPLEKFVIRAFRDRKVNDELVSTFVIPINPDNLAEDLQVRHERSQHQGAQGNDMRYRGSAPNKLSLNLLFDNTGTVEGNRLNGVPVSQQLARFKATVYDMAPETHQPYYLKIIYNTFIFDCVLTSLKIQYTLFNSVGEPIRAKVTANFEEYKEPKRRVREEDKRSPDLTHVRVVGEGDNLPLMTYRIYGDTKYYLQVAKANGLTNIRRLNVGSQLILPAIDKELNG